MRLKGATVKLALTTALYLLGSEPLAAEYFLAPSGNDANPGTKQQPWRTLDRIQTAQSSLKPGDFIYFRGGNYVITSSSARSYYAWTASGTASAPITYKSYEGEKAVILFDRRVKTGAAWVDRLGTLSGDYLILDGLSFIQTEESRKLGMVDNTVVDKNYTPTAFYIEGDSIVIRNCTISNFSGQGLHPYGGSSNLLVENSRFTGMGSHAWYIVARNGTYRYNLVDGARGHNGQWGIQLQYRAAKGNKLYGNVLMNGRSAGILFAGQVSNNEVFNNVVINGGSKPIANGGGSAIGFWCTQEQSDGSPGIIGVGNKVYNNTFIGNTTRALISDHICSVEPGLYGGRNVQIYNNIFHPSVPTKVGLSLGNVRDNIFYNISGAIPASNRLINPMLVNPAGTQAVDARLKPGSPAIDQAAAGAPGADFFKTARPKGARADVGAHEFASSPLVPAKPNEFKVQ